MAKLHIAQVLLFGFVTGEVQKAFSQIDADDAPCWSNDLIFAGSAGCCISALPCRGWSDADGSS